MRRFLSPLLLPLLLSLLTAATLASTLPRALCGEEPPPRKGVREAARNFLADGRYLVTFPTRANAKGASLTAAFLAGTVLLVGLDDEIRREVIESDHWVPDQIATKFEPIGRYWVQAAGLGGSYLASRWSKRPRETSTAATAFEAYLWTSIITSAAKGLFGRERPTEGADADDFFAGGDIFPSGHTARSFAIASVLASRHGRKAALFAYPAAALVGLATVQEDLHWTSDILAGAGLGLAIGKGIAARHPVPGPRGTPQARWRIVPGPGGVMLSFKD